MFTALVRVSENPPKETEVVFAGLVDEAVALAEECRAALRASAQAGADAAGNRR